MNFRKWHLIPLVSAFVLTAVWLMPLRVVLNAAGMQDLGFSWAHLSGNIRSGQVTGLRLGDQVLGDLDIQWQPSRLLVGRLAYRANVRGQLMSGQTDLNVGLGGFGIKGLTGRAKLAEIVSLPLDFRRTDGILSFDNLSVDFDGSDCRNASGRANSNVLTNLVEPFGLVGSELTGEAICDGVVMSIPLRGNLNQTEDVILYIRGGGGESANIDVIINTDDPVLSGALTSRGFTSTPSGVRAYYAIRGTETYAK